MTVEEAIRHRRSIRRFQPDPIPATAIRDMLALAALAPSIGNRQMWRFIVVTDPHLRQMLARCVERQIDAMADWPEFDGQSQRIRALRETSLHFAGAPAVIFVINQGYRTPVDAMLVEHGMKAWEVGALSGNPDIQSVSGVIAYLTLLAEERGYGACWITSALVAQKDLQASLEVKSGEVIAAIVSLGKPAEFPAPKARKAIDELIEWR